MAVFVGGLCCLGAAALYLIGQSEEEDAEVYKSVTPVKQLKDLGQLLKTANKVLVKISGSVNSDTPVKCKYSGLQGVIVEEKAYQNILKQNDEGKWYRDEMLMLSTSKKVPWYLDDGSARVRVTGASSSNRLLKLTSEVYEDSGRSLVHGTCDCVQGPKMLGVTRIERVLPTGTQLTIVGKATKNNNGTFWIQRPRYVAHGNIHLDQIVAEHRTCAYWFKFASIGLAAIGFCIIATHTFQFIRDKTRRREVNKRGDDAAAKRKTPDNKGSKGARKDEQMPVICGICLAQEYNSVFIPCGHMCVTCSSKFTSCPLCQS